MTHTPTRKNITKTPGKKLDSETRKLIKGTAGLQALIASIGNLSPSYVSKVVRGAKAPSDRFWKAFFSALDQARNQAVATAIKGRFRAGA